jgi:hypothetical protein
MSRWVVVNGARVEKNYLKQNLEEARKLLWESALWDQPESHGHCVVCNVAISGRDQAYRSDGDWLCTYCFERFITKQPGRLL